MSRKEQPGNTGLVLVDLIEVVPDLLAEKDEFGLGLLARVSRKVGQCISIMPSDVLRPKGVTEHLAELVVDWCLPRDNVDRPACGFGLE